MSGELISFKINRLIEDRRSLRSYRADKLVEPEVLLSLFEAARWAPSAFNEQPWRFIYAFKNTSAYEKMFATLSPGNQTWAVNAPVLVCAVVKLNSSHNEEYNRHAMHDLGIAMGMFSIQATDLGLNLHQMGGFDRAKLEADFNIPAGFEAVTVTSVGYSGPADQLAEPFLSRELGPRKRKELKDIAFEGTWKF